MKYRKKPVVIEAVQFNEADLTRSMVALGDFLEDSGAHFDRVQIGAINMHEWELTIPTLEGDMVARYGDWIIKGVNGEFYPCKPDIFDKTYERVEEE